MPIESTFSKVVSMTTALKLTSHHKQTLHWRNSQRMKEALHLLQMTSYDLKQIIDHKIEQNPLLELQNNSLSKPSASTYKQEDPKELNFENDTFERINQIDDDFHHHFSQSSYDFERQNQTRESNNDPLQNLSYCPNFLDQISQDLIEISLDAELRMIAIQLVNFVNDFGFLEESLEKISLLINQPLSLVLKAQALLQQLQPLGFGSLNLQEALLYQLRVLKLHGSLCYRVIQDHFSDLLTNRMIRIAKAFKITPESLYQQLQDHFLKLNMQLGRQERSSPAYIIDLLFFLHEGRLSSVLNEEYEPHLQINHSYIKALQNDLLANRSYLKSMLAEGRWLIKSIEIRKCNMLLVAKSIAKRQHSYLCALGPLQPMTLKDVAKDCGLHLSTVSRIVQDKTAQAPCGIVTLQEMFSYGYSNQAIQSADAICEKIAHIIHHENPQAPFSDERIVSELKGYGIACARRTVAKYRVKLGLGSCAQRHRF
jgi:RNA polymerase sigma-54 factor